MPSIAFRDHLLPLLADARHLNETRQRLPPGTTDRPGCLLALNRGVVVVCISAWEAYVEALVRESLEALRPPAPPLGLWPALNATVRGQFGRFNTPSTDNVRLLISDALGLANVHHAWTWPRTTSSQAVALLAAAMDLRHQIAHGVNPRPIVHNGYATQLPVLFRRLGRCTDAAVRSHLVATLGIANPWPP